MKPETKTLQKTSGLDASTTADFNGVAVHKNDVKKLQNAVDDGFELYSTSGAEYALRRYPEGHPSHVPPKSGSKSSS